MGLVQEFCECVAELEVIGVTGLILSFGGLIGGEVQFAVGDGTGIPVSPFGIAGEWSADAVAHESWFSGWSAIVVGRSGMLGEGCGFAGGIGLGEDGDEAVTFESGWLRESAEIIECGEEIDEFGDGRCLAPRLVHRRRVNHERYASIVFEV